MLNIEVIKFEAQDVITASVAAPEVVEPACEHADDVKGPHIHEVHGYHENDAYCADCGKLLWCRFDGMME